MKPRGTLDFKTALLNKKTQPQILPNILDHHIPNESKTPEQNTNRKRSK